jgi:uncharacterized protein YukE
MTSIVPTDDPTSYLVSPENPGSGMFIWQLRMECGIVIGGLDAVISAITGFSPLEEWVFKPLAGDWNALDRGAVAWSSAGRATKAVANNIDALPGQIGDAWQGGANASFSNAQAKIASAVHELPGSCDAMSEMVTALADLARTIAEFVAMIIKAISEWALKMLASAVVPVAGEVAMAGWLVELGAKIASWVPKLTGMITKFIAFVAKIAPIIKKVVAVILKIDAMLAKLAAVFKALDAASRLTTASAAAVT